MKSVYMDYASTTPVDKEVLDEMLPYFDKIYGNASSIHKYGIEAFDANEVARERVGSLINAKPDEIIFTSGGTESDNLGIKGIAFKNKKKRNTKGYHIITCEIEHPAVLETCKHLEKIGYNVKDLKRIMIGDYRLENIPEGKYRVLNEKEVKKLLVKNDHLQ